MKGALAANHPDTADILGDLADTLMALGRTAEAAKVSARAIGIWESDGTLDSPGFAAALKLRANVLAVSGKLSEAREYYVRALEITERILGSDHPNSADLRVRLAAVAMDAGQNELAREQALAAEDAARRFLLLTLRYLPEREAVSYALRRPSGLNLALSIAVVSSRMGTSDSTSVFDAVVNSRALVFDEIAARRRMVGAAPEGNLAVRWTAWISARQRLANLAVRAGQAQWLPSQLSMLQEARREAERTERALAEQSATFQADQKKSTINLNELQGKFLEEARSCRLSNMIALSMWYRRS